jgi:hypothetical protein
MPVLWEILCVPAFGQDTAQIPTACKRADRTLVTDRLRHDTECNCLFVPVAWETEDEEVARKLRNAVAQVRGEPIELPVPTVSGVLQAAYMREEMERLHEVVHGNGSPPPVGILHKSTAPGGSGGGGIGNAMWTIPVQDRVRSRAAELLKDAAAFEAAVRNIAPEPTPDE